MSSKMKESASVDSDTQELGSSSGAEEQEKYSVEKILNKRTRNGKHENYLKWKNYFDDDCEELIGEYEEQAKCTSSNSTMVNIASLSDTGASKERKRDTTPKHEVDKANKVDKVAKVDKADEVDKTTKVDKADKVEMSDNVEKVSNGDRTDKDDTINVSKGSEVDEDDAKSDDEMESVFAGFIPRNPQKEPEKIISVSKASGQLMFLMKWKDIDLPELTPAEEINEICPEMVIKFYEAMMPEIKFDI